MAAPKVSVHIVNRGEKGRSWGVQTHVSVTIVRPKKITDMDDERWASIVGVSVGESVGKRILHEVKNA